MVASVTDGRTLKLADGRDVRLAAIEAPPDGTAPANAGVRPEPCGWSVAADDRYGRLVAYRLSPDRDEKPLQFALTWRPVRRGSPPGPAASPAPTPFWRPSGTPGRAKRGLWADPNFAPLAAENLPQLAAARGHFALVEGQVLSVRESGATIYVNFGRRWTRDFTVTILKRQKRSFAAAGIDVDRLQGRRIRVRGIIEQRSGPIIEALAPEQIEAID